MQIRIGSLPTELRSVCPVRERHFYRFCKSRKALFYTDASRIRTRIHISEFNISLFGSTEIPLNGPREATKSYSSNRKFTQAYRHVCTNARASRMQGESRFSSREIEVRRQCIRISCNVSIYPKYVYTRFTPNVKAD